MHPPNLNQCIHQHPGCLKCTGALQIQKRGDERLGTWPLYSPIAVFLCRPYHGTEGRHVAAGGEGDGERREGGGGPSQAAEHHVRQGRDTGTVSKR